MIDRTFKKLKYRRDYLFNSKKSEKKYFKYFTDEDEGFNWIDYRRNTMIWFDDKLNVIFSYKLLFQKVSYVLGALGLIQLFLNMFIGEIIIGLSLISYACYHFYKWKQSQEIRGYFFALSIINDQIERSYNLKLSINPQK